MSLKELMPENTPENFLKKLEEFDQIDNIDDDGLEAVSESEFLGLSNDVDNVVGSLESVIESGQCSRGTALLIYGSLESLADRIGYDLVLPSLEDDNVDVEQLHNVALEAFGDIIGRYIQAYVNYYKTLFAGLIILFRGRAKLALRHKNRIGEYRDEWKAKKGSLWSINQQGSSIGVSTAPIFFRHNKVEQKPYEAIADDMTFYRWLFGAYTKDLERLVNTAGTTIASVRCDSDEAVDKLVAKVIKLKNPVDLFSKRYLNSGPVLLGNIGFKITTTSAPKPAGRTDDYIKLAEMAGPSKVVRDVFMLKPFIDPSMIWKDLTVRTEDVLHYLDLMEESCDIMIDYVERMNVHLAPYKNAVDDVAKAFRDISGLDSQHKRAVKQITNYVDGIRSQHFWLVKTMSMNLMNLNTAGVHFISRLIARSK